jgi:hypothetical protein
MISNAFKLAMPNIIHGFNLGSAQSSSKKENIYIFKKIISLSLALTTLIVMH